MLYQNAIILNRINRRLPRLAQCGGGCAGIKRFKQTPSSPSASEQKQQRNLKWTERKEAPRWLKKMAPTKGGTALPTPKEAAVIGVVAAAGYYAWFVDPPKRVDEH
mmetsp:Transcript_15724/g.33249  ORF Transcript_15724/g.33249 Transcript_15724/m.33249 type:complete len:106 (-) Transcript_15724:591-908(-)